MLTGLEILLARMKTNPEEFLKDNSVPYDGERFGGKWSDLLDYAWRVADEEERKVLNTARDEFYRDDFNERVMKRLAGEEQEQEEHPMQKFRIKTPPQNMALQNSVSVSNGGTGAQQATANSLQAMGSGGVGVQGVMQGGFGQAQTRQEGATISTDSSFWNGVIASGNGKLW